MNRREFLQKQYELSVQAGVSQRYHQSRAFLWGWVNLFCMLASALLALAGAVFAGVSLVPDLPKWVVYASIGLSILAAVFTLGLLVFQVGTWENYAQDLHRRWTDLRAEVDALQYGLGATPTAAQIACLKSLESKAHALCGMERKPSEKLVKQFYAAEVASRQPDKAA